MYAERAAGVAALRLGLEIQGPVTLDDPAALLTQSGTEGTARQRRIALFDPTRRIRCYIRHHATTAPDFGKCGTDGSPELALTVRGILRETAIAEARLDANCTVSGAAGAVVAAVLVRRGTAQLQYLEAGTKSASVQDFRSTRSPT